MQPLIFLQNGEQATIRRIGGAAETKRFLANLGFVEQAQISVKYDHRIHRNACKRKPERDKIWPL